MAKWIICLFDIKASSYKGQLGMNEVRHDKKRWNKLCIIDIKAIKPINLWKFHFFQGNVSGYLVTYTFTVIPWGLTVNCKANLRRVMKPTTPFSSASAASEAYPREIYTSSSNSEGISLPHMSVREVPPTPYPKLVKLWQQPLCPHQQPLIQPL
jgi:hypothetical protein